MSQSVIIGKFSRSPWKKSIFCRFPIVLSNYCGTIIEEKINAIATKIYGADGVDYTPEAEKELANLEKIGFGKVPVCMAKTQYSLTDDQTKLGRPTGFRITVRQVTISAGAGFVVALTGEIMKMPGLPKVPAAEKIDVDENGVISGLF